MAVTHTTVYRRTTRTLRHYKLVSFPDQTIISMRWSEDETKYKHEFDSVDRGWLDPLDSWTLGPSVLGWMDPRSIVPRTVGLPPGWMDPHYLRGKIRHSKHTFAGQ